MNLKEMIDQYRASVIKEMVMAAGAEPVPRKATNVETLVYLFPEMNRIKRELAKLSEEEKFVLGYLQGRSGRSGFQRLQRALAATELFKKSRASGSHVVVNGRSVDLAEANPHYKGQPTFEDVLAKLALKGLVFSEQPLDESRTTLDWLHGRVIYIPQYVRKYLKEIELPTVADAGRTGAPLHVVSGSAQAFQRNLSRFTRYLRRRGRLEMTTQGFLYKNDLRELANELSFVIDTSAGMKEPDNGRLYFMRRLLPKVGLAEQPGPLVTIPLIAKEQPQFIRLPLAERVEQCFKAWLQEGVWHELAQLAYYSGGVNLDYYASPSFVAIRQLILNHISAQPGEWIALDDLIDDIRETDYGFLFPNRQLRGQYDYYRGRYMTGTPYTSGNNQFGANFKEIKDEADGWNKVEAHLINHIIAGPLYWMGLVDLGYSKEPPIDLQGNKLIDSFRLTAYGRWLINDQKKPGETPATAGTVIVQPTFEIVTMGPIGDEILLTLDLFARNIKEDAHVSTFLLERDSVYQAQKADWSVARIIAYLEALSKRPLPQNVRRSLEEWGALNERIVIRRKVRLLETADEETAAAVEQELAQSQLRRVLPTVFLSNQTAAQLASQLDKARWIPLRTPAKNTSAHNSIILDDKGNIRFTQPTPSIFARHILRSISVETADGRQLTKPLVKALVSQGSLEQLIMQLQQLNKGLLPPKLIVKLKAWTGYYGEARQGTVTLIEFASEQVRDELVHDEELRDYLTIFPASGRALALVHPDHIQTVQRILAERDINVTMGLE